MSKEIINTQQAPAAVGPYAQAVRCGNNVYISGQIPLRPDMTMVSGDIQAEAKQVFNNLKAICEAAGGSLTSIVKLNIFLTNMSDFTAVNAVMVEFIPEPFPARACVGVNELPKGVRIEADAIMTIDG